MRVKFLKCYGPSVTSVSVTKAGLTGTDRRDGRGQTMGRRLSESRGSGLVRVGVRNVRTSRTEKSNVLTYLVFHRSKDLYLRTVSPYCR